MKHCGENLRGVVELDVTHLGVSCYWYLSCTTSAFWLHETKGFPLSFPSCIMYLPYHRPTAVWAEIYKNHNPDLISPLFLVVCVRHLVIVTGNYLA